MGHRLLLVLPALAAAIVGWAVLGGGAEHVRYVQVLGGPTREGSTLSVLLRALEQLDDDRRVPISGLAVRVVAQAGSSSAVASGATDAAGQLELRLDFGVRPTENPRLRVEQAHPGEAPLLAQGVIALDVERWRAGARRDGGWLPGQAQGELRVRVAAESGVFAVPFAGNLVLQVLAPRGAGLRMAKEGMADEAVTDGADGAVPLSGVLAEVELDGAELIAATPDIAATSDIGTTPHIATTADAVAPPNALGGAALPETVESEATPPPKALPPTDTVGQTRIALRPLEHAVSARIVVRVGERRGQWYGALPVIPGALAAALSGTALAVRSPIPREQAYLSIVSARERIAGAIVPLAPAADGGARGHFELGAALAARLDVEPTWAIISSEYDKRSSGVVGWPLRPAFDVTSPRLTFGVPDQVLLDGRNGALYAVQQRQRSRRSIAAAGLVGIGALLSAAFWNEVRRGRRRAGDPRAARPEGADERPPIAAGGWLLGVALGCIALGFGALAYFAWLAE